MLEENGMKELYEEVKRYKDEKEILEVIIDIDKVQNMINLYCRTGQYDQEEAEKIEKKYLEETTFLISLEKLLNLVVSSNSKSNFDINLQFLVNLRHRLYRIAVLKIMKLHRKEITNEVVSKNYNTLVRMIKK